MHRQRLDARRRELERGLELRVVERIERQHGRHARRAQSRHEGVQAAAGALRFGQQALDRHQHREVGAERGADALGHVAGRAQRLAQQREAPGLVVLAARGASRPVGRARFDRTREDAALAQSRQSRGELGRRLEDASGQHRVEPGARSQQVAPPRAPPPARRHAGRGRARARRDRPGAPTPIATAPPTAASSSTRCRSAARTSGGKPGGKNARAKRASVSGSTRAKQGCRGQQYARRKGHRRQHPRAPAFRKRRQAQPREQRDRQVCREEGLHRKAEDAQRAQLLDQRGKPGPAAERDQDRERAQESQPSGVRAPGSGSGGGERERGGSEVEAQDVGKAARKEILAPPLVRQVGEVAEEAAHDRLQQGEGMDRVGEHHVRREALPAGAALHLARHQHQHRRSECRAERQRPEATQRRPPALPWGEPQPDAGEDRLGDDLDARGRERQGDGERRPRDRPRAAAIQDADESEHHERRPRGRLDVDVEVDGRQQEAAEARRRARRRRRRPAEAPGRAPAAGSRTPRAARGGRAAARAAAREARRGPADRADSRAGAA